MSKMLLFLVVSAAVVYGAFYSAQEKMHHRANLNRLSLGMTVAAVEKTFGVPTAQDRNQLIYILEDSSELTISLRDGVVTSAKMKFMHPVTVSDPELKKLTLVQMDTMETDSGQPNWFFAGKPEEGLIYKITSSGEIESMTWVQPFTYRQHRPKNVQVLLRDFKSKELSNM